MIFLKDCRTGSQERDRSGYQPSLINTLYSAFFTQHFLQSDRQAVRAFCR
ncbi:hypothetical protein [Leptolyngbya sp. FACHB-711]|nr:hypothetical protein [Leptolyngbya sp. FACHB-711]MBD1849067.1 hypothetical protein [Cyanobacteria bacterium FACHB-502]MBD2024748.1 hypothetical protein [Leptolyngbya sp. FACHB-711]